MKDDTKHDVEQANRELRLAEHEFFRDTFNNLRKRHNKIFILGVVAAVLVTFFVLWAAGCGLFHWICKIRG